MSRTTNFKLFNLLRKDEPEAPRWDGRPCTLKDFLDDFGGFCSQYGVPEDRRMDALLRYAPDHDHHEHWKLCRRRTREEGWGPFCQLLIKNTPGADEERTFTKADLDELASEYRHKPKLSMEEFATLWKRFYVASQYLHSR
ncbi:hypothetical protein FA15DRAFT_243771 [Coprinopsis marcescibilis]|uniref:Uncharacterized protein n=1 Tax=Coprinopsis marcescibilis TaxID=230819 RepID=A0A5C3KF22_COPMA|nr:hypothetical protein FA15DRAFT_243771 [Coprinopsis marcescibilis]